MSDIWVNNIEYWTMLNFYACKKNINEYSNQNDYVFFPGV